MSIVSPENHRTVFAEAVDDGHEPVAVVSVVVCRGYLPVRLLNRRKRREQSLRAGVVGDPSRVKS